MYVTLLVEEPAMAKKYYGRKGKDVKWGYFLKVAEGKAVAAGTSVGPKEPGFKPGDVFPRPDSSGEKFARVLKVITGPAAQAMGFGVVIVLEEIKGPTTVQ